MTKQIRDKTEFADVILIYGRYKRVLEQKDK